MQWLDIGFWLNYVLPPVAIILFAVTVYLIVEARVVTPMLEFWSGSIQEQIKCTEHEFGITAKKGKVTLAFVKRKDLKPKMMKKGFRMYKVYHATEANCVVLEPDTWNLNSELTLNKAIEANVQDYANHYLNKHREVIDEIKKQEIDWDNPVQMGVLVDAERLEADRRGMVNVMPSELGRQEDIGIDRALNDWGTGAWNWSSVFVGIGIMAVVVIIMLVFGYLKVA